MANILDGIVLVPSSDDPDDDVVGVSSDSSDEDMMIVSFLSTVELAKQTASMVEACRQSIAIACMS